MPKVGGLDLLNDRVFYVLVVTAHSTYDADTKDDAMPSQRRRQSFTAQLPVNFESFSGVDAMLQRSHVKMRGSSMYFQRSADQTADPKEPASTKPQRNGQKLTEGNYVSLERVREAPETRPSNVGRSPIPSQKTEPEYSHRWDMMTLSKAGGITRFAPKRIQIKETLDAIAADVHYVIKHIAEQRQ